MGRLASLATLFWAKTVLQREHPFGSKDEGQPVGNLRTLPISAREIVMTGWLVRNAGTDQDFDGAGSANGTCR